MAATKAKAKAAKKRVKVLIADDQTLFREGIKDLLENEKTVEVIGEAADGSEVVRLAKKLRPDEWQFKKRGMERGVWKSKGVPAADCELPVATVVNVGS